jgi:flavin reductase (DIM6/NTAB) family NADH-FMN oxidoreductase RutF
MCRIYQPSQETRALRSALGQFATGVAVVTTSGGDNTPVGMTINSFNSVSMTPPLVAWCIDRRAASYPVFARTSQFCISVLNDNQTELARRFASRGANKFRDIACDDAAPVIEDACAFFRCDTYQRVLLGDHLMLIGRVIAFGKQARSPLLFAGGQFHTLLNDSNTDIAA